MSVYELWRGNQIPYDTIFSYTFLLFLAIFTIFEIGIFVSLFSSTKSEGESRETRFLWTSVPVFFLLMALGLGRWREESKHFERHVHQPPSSSVIKTHPTPPPTPSREFQQI